MNIRQAVILAGGRGERLRPLTDTVPKPMVRINGKPFLEYLITLLRVNGITDILILTGYKYQQIQSYFGNGKNFGVSITYQYNPLKTQTGLRLKKSEKLLHDTFLLLYGDNYWPLRLDQIIKGFKKDADLLMTVYSNLDASSTNNVCIQKNGRISLYDKYRKSKQTNGIDIGFFILHKKLVADMTRDNLSLSEYITDWVKQKNVYGYLTDHKYYTLTDKKRLQQLEQYCTDRKILFLDRDGVINKKAPKAEYITSWKEFELLPDVIDALQRLTTQGYELFIITNQPGIARGKMTTYDLETIHNNMIRQFKKNGIRISGVYTCTHGWDEGCFCRKPRPGLLFQAASDHLINLYNTILIGDDERDILAGNAVGARTFLVTENKSLLSIVKSIL